MEDKIKKLIEKWEEALNKERCQPQSSSYLLGWLDCMHNRIEDLKKVLPKHNQDKDVHTEHCCVNCGCKYGEEDTCPVVQGWKKQSNPCRGDCRDW